MTQRKRGWVLKAAAAALAVAFGSVAAQAAAPAEVKIGTLYASSGSFAVASQGQLEGLKFWAAAVNKDGGLFVKAYDKKIPVKIVAYDDQS